MTDEQHALREPWMRRRRVLRARGRQRVPLAVVVVAYQGTVWLSIDPPFASDVAILDPPQADALIALLRWATEHARSSREP